MDCNSKYTIEHKVKILLKQSLLKSHTFIFRDRLQSKITDWLISLDKDMTAKWPTRFYGQGATFQDQTTKLKWKIRIYVEAVRKELLKTEMSAKSPRYTYILVYPTNPEKGKHSNQHCVYIKNLVGDGEERIARCQNSIKAEPIVCRPLESDIDSYYQVWCSVEKVVTDESRVARLVSVAEVQTEEKDKTETNNDHEDVFTTTDTSTTFRQNKSDADDLDSDSSPEKNVKKERKSTDNNLTSVTSNSFKTRNTNRNDVMDELKRVSVN